MKKHGGYREGAGRIPLDEKQKKKGVKIYITETVKEDILFYGTGKSFSEKTVSLIESAINSYKKETK